MKTKIPADAFDFYVAQGEQRSYQATADRFGVSKCAIVKCAKREHWVERLEKIEADARAMSDRKLTETIAEMHERHAKALKAIYARAVEGLRSYRIDNCMDAVKATEIVIRAERLMAGEVSKRTEVSIEEVMRHEMRTLLKIVDSSGNELPRGEMGLIEMASASSADAEGGDDEDDDERS